MRALRRSIAQESLRDEGGGWEYGVFSTLEEDHLRWESDQTVNPKAVTLAILVATLLWLDILRRSSGCGSMSGWRYLSFGLRSAALLLLAGVLGLWMRTFLY